MRLFYSPLRHTPSGRTSRPRLEVLEDRTVPTVLIVRNLNDIGLDSLRGALALAENGDVIVFDDSLRGGTLTLSLGPLRVTHDVSIEGLGASNLAISGHNALRVFDIAANTSVLLADLTVRNGRETAATAQGGGLSAEEGTTLEVRNCAFVSNLVQGRAFGQGGALFSQGRVTIDSSTFTGNTANSVVDAYASAAGGAIFAPEVTLLNSTLSDNTAYAYSQAAQAGGGAVSATSVTVTDSVLRNNLATATTGAASYGGAIRAASVTVSGSILENNRVTASGGKYTGFGYGGAISGNVVDVTASTLLSNSASGTGSTSGRSQGGAIQAGALVVTDSTLAGNVASPSGYRATAFGGACDSTQGTFTGCTISGNSTRGSAAGGSSGGGARASVLTMTNCTVAGNAAETTGSGAGDSGGLSVLGDLSLTSVTIANNITSGSGGGMQLSSGAFSRLLVDTIVAGNRKTSGPASDISSTGSASLDPASHHNLIGTGGSGGLVDGVNRNQVGVADARLAPLGYYGGATQTIPLLPGSPARNAGDPASNLGIDQRGQPRATPTNSDVGAFQSQDDPFLITTLTDPGRQSGLLSLREAVNLANVLPGDHTISFAGSLGAGTVALKGGPLELSGSGVLTLEGGRAYTVRGNGSSRLFQIDAGSRAVLRGLDLSNGQADLGGAVLNQGTLTVADCDLYGNSAGNGGALYNQGALTLFGSSLEGNTASNGGALYNAGSLTGYNSTIADNAAVAGGAIYNAGGIATLTSLSISRNSADAGGGLDMAGGAVLLRNSIVAGNFNADGSSASDIAGTVDAGSTYNLIGTGGGGGLVDGVGHNLVGVADPGLTGPDYSTSETAVFGFTDDSPALGAGDPTLLDDPLLSLDQHGNPRTVVNIGAV